MAETAKAETKFKHGDEQLPIHHEGRYIRVYTNPSGEIFVEDIRSGAKMRISPYFYIGGGLEFTTDARVEPILVNGMIGWRVSLR